jgi:hypothetical protein
MSSSSAAHDIAATPGRSVSWGPAAPARRNSGAWSAPHKHAKPGRLPVEWAKNLIPKGRRCAAAQCGDCQRKSVDWGYRRVWPAVTTLEYRPAARCDTDDDLRTGPADRAVEAGVG